MSLHPVTNFLFRLSSKSKSFGASFLGLRLPVDGGELRIDRFNDISISTTLPLPAWLCRPDGQLCLAGFLAMADEVSTFGMGAWDARHRPGVSVTLSGQRTSSKTIDAGEEITFNASLIKGGHSLAWMHIEALSGGELLATGRHLKFQPAGLPPFFAAVSHPLVWPFTRSLAHAGLRAWADRQPSAPMELVPRPDAPRAEALSMTEAAPTDAGAAVYSLLADGASPKSFEVALQRHHGNPGATLHGGCGTMLLEAAAAASYCAERGVAAAPPVQRMHVSLPGALGVTKPRTAVVAAVVSSTKPHAQAVLRGGAGKSTAVEADVWW